MKWNVLTEAYEFMWIMRGTFHHVIEFFSGGWMKMIIDHCNLANRFKK
jgi:hypothetical protein